MAGGVREPLAIGGSIDQQLLGHTAADHAGAPDSIAFHDGHLGAIRSGPFGGCKAAGSSPDHEQIEVVRGCGSWHGGLGEWDVMCPCDRILRDVALCDGVLRGIYESLVSSEVEARGIQITI